jgi:hypothetical protein
MLAGGSRLNVKDAPLRLRGQRLRMGIGEPQFERPLTPVAVRHNTIEPANQQRTTTVGCSISIVSSSPTWSV